MSVPTSDPARSREDPPPRAPAGPSLCCGVAACAAVRAAESELPKLRERVVAAYSATLSNAVIKQADEQSVVAWAAVAQAERESGFDPAARSGWGVVASPRTPGRLRMADALRRFRAQGAWSVSPHIVPHCSLHSLAGLLSQALDLHGPNLGVGGWRGGEADAFLAAAALLEGDGLPGLWVVWSGWESESAPPGEAVCQAVALGLVPGLEDCPLRLRITPTPPQLAPVPATAGDFPAFGLEGLARALAEAAPASVWRLKGYGFACLERRGAGDA